MADHSVLVVFHSYTGITEKVAEAIAERLGADLERIREVRPYPTDYRAKGCRNLLGFGRAGMFSVLRLGVPIHEAQRDPGAYGLVVLGTPVYGGGMAHVVRAYVNRYRDRMNDVAFFCTGEDPNGVRVFGLMEQACGKAPRAVRAFYSPKVREDDLTGVDAFASAVRAAAMG